MSASSLSYRCAKSNHFHAPDFFCESSARARPPRAERCRIPGPIEVADEVLFANAHPSMSHVSPDFIPVFGDTIRMIRSVP